jgi:hypothetical protein
MDITRVHFENYRRDLSAKKYNYDYNQSLKEPDECTPEPTVEEYVSLAALDYLDCARLEYESIQVMEGYVRDTQRCVNWLMGKTCPLEKINPEFHLTIQLL